LTSPIENKFIIGSILLMYSFFFPKLSGVLVRESHAMKILFDDVLGVVPLEPFLSKMVGKQEVYFHLGLFGVFKEVVAIVNR
jgi:hypothetical protein